MKKLSKKALNNFEYTARQKAIYDYNTLMEENWLRGLEQGAANERANLIARWKAKGMTEEEIAELLSE